MNDYKGNKWWENCIFSEKGLYFNLMVPKIYPAILLKGWGSKNSDRPNGPDNRSFSLL